MNGYMRSASEFYNDPETYPGESGCETNPWMVEDTYDFMVMKNGSGSEPASYYTLANNIDFNDNILYKRGIGDDVFVGMHSATHEVRFDGNGKQIRNMVFVGRNFTEDSKPFAGLHTFKNTNVVNMVTMSCGGIDGWLEAIENDNNSFNILLFTPRSFGHCLPRNMTECTFNVSCPDISSRIDMASAPIKRCHINLQLNSIRQRNIFDNINWDTCLVSGHWNSVQNSGTPSIFNNEIILNNVAFVMENRTTMAKANLGTINTPIGMNVFDGTTNKMDMTQKENYAIITDEQMKDTEYLQNLGFPVVKVAPLEDGGVVDEQQ